MSKKVMIIFGSFAVVVMVAVGAIVFRGHAQSQDDRQEIRVLKRGEPNSTPPITQANEKEIDDASTPIVNFNTVEADSSNELRRLKNRRFDNRRIVVDQPAPNSGEVTIVTEEVIPELPFIISDLVVEAKVSSSRAFLSDDRTGIYSEFTIRIKDILTSNNSISFRRNDQIVTERFGGRVRYPSGQIVRYSVSEKGSPTIGKTYIFFLKRTDNESFRILTAYEIRGNRVFPLDGSRTTVRGRGTSAFDQYSGRDLREFRDELDIYLDGAHQ